MASALHSGEDSVEDLDVDMVALLSENNVSHESMQEFAKAECTSVCLFAALADDREGVRKAIKNLIGLDPSERKAQTIEMAKIVAAWKTSNIRSDVVVKANAVREANFLPLKVPEKELDMAQLAYEKFEDIELTDEVAPGQAYYERKITELSSTLKAGPLTMATTKAHDELYRGMLNLGADPVSGLFKISQNKLESFSRGIQRSSKSDWPPWAYCTDTSE